MKIRFLIVDDEPLARKLIASHASRIPELEFVAECGNAIEALSLVRSKQIDLIFLDIQMPEITGLQFIKSLKNPPAVILTTAFRDFAPESYDIDAVDYLLKPVAFDRFFKAVSRLLDRKPAGEHSTAPVEIQVKSDRRIHKITLDDIIYIESLDDYVKVHLGDRFIVTRESISAFEARLPESYFVRIHRSFIVNAKKVSSVSSESVRLRDLELPFGRMFKRAALSRMNVKFET